MSPILLRFIFPSVRCAHSSLAVCLAFYLFSPSAVFSSWMFTGAQNIESLFLLVYMGFRELNYVRLTAREHLSTAIEVLDSDLVRKLLRFPPVLVAFTTHRIHLSIAFFSLS